MSQAILKKISGENSEADGFKVENNAQSLIRQASGNWEKCQEDEEIIDILESSKKQTE